MGRGQAWSIDLIFGVIIFMISVGIIYALLVSRDRQDVAPLRIESEVIANKLAFDPQLRVAENNQLNPQSLANLTRLQYDALKAQLGVQDEFCIYLEDSQGNLIYIQDGSTKYTGIGSGSGELNLSGTPCGRVCTTC
jgi:hypothetical protein